jgi:hypothetical protein
MGTSTITTFGPAGPQRNTTGGTVRPTTIRPVTARALEAQTTAPPSTDNAPAVASG